MSQNVNQDGLQLRSMRQFKFHMIFAEYSKYLWKYSFVLYFYGIIFLTFHCPVLPVY
jgi:hypothetical protein